VSDVDDARRVAQQLGIDHVVFNFGDDFRRDVVDAYVADHAAGRTPNPCVACNRHLKFDRLLRRARALGFDAVATGHHARIGARPDGALAVRRGADRAKDQSYVVHVLGGDALARTRFPVGDLTKAEVRREAARRGLRTAAKPDSQDVCFITSGGRRDFLARRLALRPGVVVDTAGRTVGAVEAVELVTLGQRAGLGLRGGAAPRYVLAVDVDAGVVTVGEASEAVVDTVAVDGWSWAAGSAPDGEVLVQVSAHGRPRPATVDGDTVHFAAPGRPVAPGQSVVVYDPSDTWVLGGATAR
jgi:tRNA-specific 2-thiouridylase